jgi:hypothetical protein
MGVARHMLICEAVWGAVIGWTGEPLLKMVRDVSDEGHLLVGLVS